MKISFYKYQGAGNDFVMVDNRGANPVRREDEATIRFLCDRRFGVGADGVILLQEKEGYDFEMVYFNADGRESSMCGNGGRCIVAFAQFLGVIDQEAFFLAIDGPHQARVTREDWVELQMTDVGEVERGADFYRMDTGSPHYVRFVEQVHGLDIVAEAHKVRYSDRFREEGINVNFVEEQSKGIKVATYERGVEDETLSCGTGVTAAAIAWYLRQPGRERREVAIQAKGGRLSVRFEPEAEAFSNIWLCGPAKQVFRGEIETITP